MALGPLTSIVYLPSKSVTIPWVVPFSTTLAPTRGSPLSEVTVPVTDKNVAITFSLFFSGGTSNACMDVIINVQQKNKIQDVFCDVIRILKNSFLFINKFVNGW